MAEEQMRLSGLEWNDALESLMTTSTTSTLSLQKQDQRRWNTTEWPPFPSSGGGKLRYHATVVVPLDGHNDHDTTACEQHQEAETSTIIFTLGGITKASYCNVFWGDPMKKQWNLGPSLNNGRYGLAAVFCHGAIYAIGGRDRAKALDTIERLDLSLKSSVQSFSSTWMPWEILPCRLTSRRCYCAAVAVLNRYIVVMGGHDEINTRLSSVDIFDCRTQTVVVGPSMTCERSSCAAAVVDHMNLVVVVGGTNAKGLPLKSLEFLHFNQSNDNSATTATVFDNKCKWVLQQDLMLNIPRNQHAITMVGSSSCLVVAGGGNVMDSVEILDLKRRVGWTLPDLTERRCGCSIVSLSKSILVLGGSYSIDLAESLPLTTKYATLKSKPCELTESDTEIEKLRDLCERAKMERTEVGIFQQGVQERAPATEPLRRDDKFRSSQELRDELHQLLRALERGRKETPIVTRVNAHEKAIDKSAALTVGDHKTTNKESYKTGLNAFYQRLVEPHEYHVVLKLHDLATLICGVHEMKIFYTLLKHLLRTDVINLHDCRRLTLQALHTTTQTIYAAGHGGGTRFLLEKIVQTCRSDGSVDDDTSMEQLLSHGNGSPSPSSTVVVPRASLVTDIRQHLAGLEFRVGRLDTRNPTSTVGRGNLQLLSQVRILGWSLMQLHSAFCRKQRNEITLTVICSILNACSYGVDDVVQVQDDAASLMTSVLAHIVDYGDLAHITSVLQEIGNSSMQRACDQSMAILQRVSGGGPLLGEYVKEGTDALVGIMGLLANATKNSPDNAGKEEPTLMALVITAALIQIYEVNLKPSFDSAHDDSKTASLPTVPQETLALTLDTDPFVSGQPMSIQRRMQRLEATLGAAPIVKRLAWMEETNGVDGNRMTIGSRLVQLEGLLFDSTHDHDSTASLPKVPQEMPSQDLGKGRLLSGQPLSIPMRIQRLEATLGTAPLVKRLASMEETNGVDGKGMTVTARITQLERLLE